MILHSVRFKIVLWCMVILSLALMVFGLALYQNFKHRLSNDINDLLRWRAKGIVDSIETYWDTERLESQQERDFVPKEGNINFIKIAQRWVGEKNTDPSLVNFVVSIYDGKGQLIASSKALQVQQMTLKYFDKLKQGQSYFENMQTNGGVILRSYTSAVIENRKVVYIVQVSSPLMTMNAALNNLSLLLFVLLPATVLITALSGAFLANLALKPVHEMIDTIHQITAENLKLRIKIPDTKDEIQSLALTFNDMIERLDHSFTSQRQFMEDISHELKTPLSILKGELEVTLKTIRSAQEYETTLQSSLEEINRLIRIVENLLTLARFDTKTFVLDPVLINLSQLIGDVVEDIRILADQKSIALTYNLNPDDVIMADRSQMRRVMLNLLDNAIKYTPKGGKVSIDVSQQADNIQIKVADTGVGIPAEDLPHVFDRFYRVDKSRSSSGFGLGLSIAQSIIRAQNGTIEASSNIPQGTIFSVLLPKLK